jgi:hypothetical protein
MVADAAAGSGALMLLVLVGKQVISRRSPRRMTSGLRSQRRVAADSGQPSDAPIAPIGSHPAVVDDVRPEPTGAGAAVDPRTPADGPPAKASRAQVLSPYWRRLSQRALPEPASFRSPWAGRLATSARARDVALSLLVVLAAVSVVLATRSARPATSGVAGDQPVASTSVAPTGAVRVVARERAAAGGMTLTVSVPGAPRAAALPPSAFEVSVDGRPTATTVQPVAPAGQNLAVVVDTSADATRADLQTAGNGLTELGLQLPTGSRVAVIGTAGPALIQPMTADVTTAVKALDRVRLAGTSAPGAALRLAAQQVASAPRLHRAVLVNGSGTVDQKEQEVIDATLSAQMAGTPVSLVGNGTPGSDALRTALTTTGGAVYTVSAGAPLTAYDALAADFANQYRLTFPAPATSAAATVRVNAPGVAGSVATTVDPQLP